MKLLKRVNEIKVLQVCRGANNIRTFKLTHKEKQSFSYPSYEVTSGSSPPM